MVEIDIDLLHGIKKKEHYKLGCPNWTVYWTDGDPKTCTKREFIDIPYVRGWKGLHVIEQVPDEAKFVYAAVCRYGVIKKYIVDDYRSVWFDPPIEDQEETEFEDVE